MPLRAGQPDHDQRRPTGEVSNVRAGDSEPQSGAGLERALGIAYRYLNRRECTEAEMRSRLGRADIELGDAEEAIATLLEQGYLDDARFARLFAQDKRELEQWGSDRIKRALLERGVPSGLVEDVLDVEPGESEKERALAVLRRRFPAPVGDRRERERALGILLRKGYDADLALDAIAVHRAIDDVDSGEY
jgi:regulatory protein